MPIDAPVRLPPPDRDIRYAAGDAMLYAASFGGGRPLVMIHGGLSDHRGALLPAAPLLGRLWLLTPDLRGCGRSPAVGALSWQLLADDLAALLDHLGLRRAVVGAVSAGCGVATAFALHHPDRCAGLALVTPTHGGAAMGLTEQQIARFRHLHHRARAAQTRGIGALLPLYDPLPAVVRGISRAIARSFDLDALTRHTALLASGMQPFADEAELAAIEVPTLLVPGADREHPAAASAAYIRNLPDCVTLAPDGRGFADAVVELVDRSGVVAPTDRVG